MEVVEVEKGVERSLTVGIPTVTESVELDKGGETSLGIPKDRARPIGHPCWSPVGGRQSLSTSLGIPRDVRRDPVTRG